MAGKRDKPEEIVAKLQQVEVLHGQGMTVADRLHRARVALGERLLRELQRPPAR